MRQKGSKRSKNYKALVFTLSTVRTGRRKFAVEWLLSVTANLNMAGDRETGLPQPRGRPGPLQTYCSTDPLADRGWPEIPGRPALQTPENVSSDLR